MTRKTTNSNDLSIVKKEIISDYVKLTHKEKTKPAEVYRKLRRKIVRPQIEKTN